ncbi:MAG TPA: SDR family NAD(P)-dependent oxidoreductase [Microthrixaceae bacterium]|nr:SDR family NAD(P)-dependent oxidoreductase [Microthrixaceae bacterium]
MRSFVGRVAVVTGAGSGIGRATSLALVRRGCHVAIVDRDLEAAGETASLVSATGRRASAHGVDVRDLHPGRCSARSSWGLRTLQVDSAEWQMHGA